MNDSLKKAIAKPMSLLESPQSLHGKDPVEFTKEKVPKKEFFKKTDIDFVPKQAGRDWWWCDDV